MQTKNADIFENLYRRPGHPNEADLGLDIFGELPGLLAKRSVPGILIFNAQLDLIYFNPEARRLLTPRPPENPAAGDGASVPEGLSVPQAVKKLCRKLQAFAHSRPPARRAPTLSKAGWSPVGEEPVTFRAFWLDNDSPRSGRAGYILTLIERISPSKSKVFDPRRAAHLYRLSGREMEIITLLAQGHTNKELSEKLFVCLYTVEGHLKKIMKKMGVSSRTGVLAKLLDMA